MAQNYNLEDDDELLYRNEQMPIDEEVVEPLVFGSENNPALKQDMPNVPRNPDDPQQKLRDYFKKQDALNKQNQGADRRDMGQYRKSNSEIGLAQLFNQAANQFGSIGGKAASSAPLDQFSQGLKQNNALEMQMARGGRAADASNQDRKLKMMQYMERQGFQDQEAKSKQSNANRMYNLQKDKFDWDRTHTKGGTDENDGGELLSGIPKRLWNKATEERKKIDEHNNAAKDIRQNLNAMAGIGLREGYTPGWLGGKSSTYDSLASNVSAAIVGRVPGIRSDNDYKNIVVPMLPNRGTTPEDAKKKVDIFMAWLESLAPESPVLDNYGKRPKPIAPALPPEEKTAAPAAAAPAKPIHQMTREEKLKELEALGG